MFTFIYDTVLPFIGRILGSLYSLGTITLGEFVNLVVEPSGGLSSDKVINSVNVFTGETFTWSFLNIHAALSQFTTSALESGNILEYFFGQIFQGIFWLLSLPLTVIEEIIGWLFNRVFVIIGNGLGYDISGIPAWLAFAILSFGTLIGIYIFKFVRKILW